MSKRKLRILIVSLATGLVGAIGLPIVARAAIPNCTVGTSGEDYATIQLALAVPGCTNIKVSPGSYAGPILIDHTVTLKGARAGISVNARTFSDGAESTVTGLVTIGATDVMVDGFSLTNPNQGLGVVVKTAGYNAVVKNNIVDTVGGVGFSPNAVGIYLEYGPDNVKVEKNRISNIKSIPSAQGILIGDSTSANPSLDIRLTSNTITGVTSTSAGAYGVEINNGANPSPSSTGYTTVKIRDNTISHLAGAWDTAIGLEGETPNAVVSHNTISLLDGLTPAKVAIHFEDNPFFFTANVNRNSLDVGSSAAGIFVDKKLTDRYPSLEVDGTCNWWGAANGPVGVFGAVATGSGSGVNLGVDFNPWLKSSNLNGKCNQKDHEHDDDNNENGDVRSNKLEF